MFKIDEKQYAYCKTLDISRKVVEVLELICWNLESGFPLEVI